MAFDRPYEKATATLLLRKCTAANLSSSKMTAQMVSLHLATSCFLRYTGSTTNNPYYEDYSFMLLCFSFSSRISRTTSLKNLPNGSLWSATEWRRSCCWSCHSSLKTHCAVTSYLQILTVLPKMRSSLCLPNMSSS